MKSEFLMSLVVARKLAVLTTAEGPNRIPSRLMSVHKSNLPVDYEMKMY
jgi:hypothetical protein